MDMEEYKLLNGWSYDKKRGSTRYDRVPVGIRRIVKFDRIEDYMQLVPADLKEDFTVKDFAMAAGSVLKRQDIRLIFLIILR